MAHHSSDARLSDDVLGIRQTYDLVAADYDAQLGDELRDKPLDRALLQALAELAADGTLADVGCGPGHVSAFLADHHPDVIGLDLSPQMIDLARRRRPRQRFAVADMRALPAGDGEWAGIAALYSIIHLTRPQRAQAFTEFRRTLRPGGRVLLAFHVEDALHRPGEVNRLTTWFGRDVDIDGHFLDPQVVTEELRSVGLAVTAQLLRAADPIVEYPSRRAYLLARAPG